MMSILDEKIYTNYTVCKECGGHCCKKCPGEFAPHDFGDSEEKIYNNILDGLKEGVLTFNLRLIWRDRCDDIKWDPTYCSHEIIVIRPVTKPKRRHGECIFLNENGCKLSFDKRPILCKTLVPGKTKPKRCISKLSTIYNTLEWIGYGDMVSYLRVLSRKIRRQNRKKRVDNDYKYSFPISLQNRLCKKF